MKKEKLYWTTKEGVKLDIDEMSIEHLRNVVKMIVRKKRDLELIDALLNDLKAIEDNGFEEFEYYKD